MTKRDIAANINFFMNVPVTPEGLGSPSRRRDFRAREICRDARRDQTFLALIGNCPQLNNPAMATASFPVEVLI